MRVTQSERRAFIAILFNDRFSDADAFAIWTGGKRDVLERCYCPDLPQEGLVSLSGDETHHLARVRRLGSGARVVLFDGRGTRCEAEVTAVDRGRVELRIVGEPEVEPAPPCALTLATAYPKGQRLDWLVEKATELGVERLQGLLTERSVVDPRATKLERLRRIVVEASKQCGRNRLMAIEEPMTWTDYLARESAPARFLADPGGLPVSASARVVAGQRAAVAIGPEGGFTAAEAALASQAGWQSVRIGHTILRIETAALAASAFVLQRAESVE
jgi:16S rRNA (uracil1498-N3)-methyltransferase